MARPTLPRFVVPITVYVELGAEDEDHATQRAEVLTDLVRPRIKATVRATRLGGASVDTILTGTVTPLPEVTR